MQIKKVVIIGPESTGKSTLTHQLASHYNTLAVNEYAREYLSNTGNAYSLKDLTVIAKGQVELENIQSGKMNDSGSDLLFIDTDLYVIKIWSEFVFNECDNLILKTIALRSYDLYLLCNPDLPWTEDPLREYPDLATRQKLYLYYRDVMANQHIPWSEIKGNYDERLKTAVHAVDAMINQKTLTRVGKN